MTRWRLVTYNSDRGPRAGIAVGNCFVDAAVTTGEEVDVTVLGILDDWEAASKRIAWVADAIVAGRLRSAPLAGAVLLAPVHYPVTIYCAGANYTDHVARMAEVLGLPPDPDPHEAGLNPWHFIKPSRCAVGPDAIVGLPSRKMDWEVELGIVMGRCARNVPVAKAMEYVAGYVVANDLSARDCISRPGIPDGSPFKFDWVGQKCFDGSCPLGPWIVPTTDVPDPLALALSLRVNGVVRQDSTTARMIFSPAEQIAHLSSRLMLHPGDVILTGTPMGVGVENGHFLSAGDVVEAEIEGLGTLRTFIGGAAT